MAASLLIVILIVLVLLLTGTFGPVLLFSLKLGGWVLVGIIAIVLLWMAIARLVRPVSAWISNRSAISDLRHRIKKHKALGYEATDLEAELTRLMEDPTVAQTREERRRMGYQDESK